jgi:Domain of Unknown Function (DUF1080)
MLQSVIAIFFLLVLTSCATSQSWINLFDGQSLGKWQGDPAIWRVENGYISGKTAQLSANTFLIYPDTFDNFILETEVMLLDAGSFPNSGIQFRSRTVGQFVVQGYQVDIGKSIWGSLYDEGTGPMADTTAQALGTVKKNDWNKVMIEAKGQRLSFTINGTQAAIYETAVVPAGIIALQYHAPGENFEIRFRNIRLQKLE